MPGNNDHGSVKRSEAPVFPTASELQEFATDYFAEAFPNPSHAGCFDQHVIISLIRAKTLPTTELRAHLFACSHCFAAYLQALASERARQPLAQPRRWIRPALAFLVAGIMIVLALGVRLWDTRRARQPVEVAVNRPAPPPLPSAPAPSVDRSRPLKIDGIRPVKKGPSSRSVSLDLDAYAISRSVPSPDDLVSKAIRLPRGPVRLKLQLPEGRLPGIYTIRFIDDNERSVVTTRARSADGQMLSVSLDTGMLPSSMMRLSLEHSQQAPLDFMVILSSELK